MRTILICMGLLLLGGCQLFGVVASGVASQMPVEAVYTPAKKPMLVMVVDQPDPRGANLESEAIASQIDMEVKEHQIAPLVPSEKIVELRSSMPGDFSRMTPAEIGKTLGAQQIMQVQITQSSTDSGGAPDMLKGNITTLVSIVSATDGQLLWPTDGSPGYSISYATPLMRVGDEVSETSVRQNLYAGLAYQIGELFYKHRKD